MVGKTQNFLAEECGKACTNSTLIENALAEEDASSPPFRLLKSISRHKHTHKQDKQLTNSRTHILACGAHEFTGL